MFYEHLNKYPVKKGPVGPAVLKANLVVPVAAGTSIYKIEENSPVERAYAVGLWATLPGAKVDATNTQASSNAWNSAYLVIRYRNTEIYQKVALEQVRLANSQGRPYYINLPGPINLSETTLNVPDNSGISSNTVIEFQIDYIEPAI